VYLILVKDGKILLSKRVNTGYQDGNFGLVAGHLDGGETAKQGIIREAKEEAGIKLKDSDLEVVHVMHECTDLEYIDIYLKVGDWEGDIINREIDKCSKLMWFSLDALPENIIPKTKISLENVKNKIFYDEFS
jgi:8-oxo-dGTP pyrophosphatase MutT (NUDIX family)